MSDNKKNQEHATELEYLIWFRVNADFGPASEDVVRDLNDRFREETGKELPEDWVDCL